MKIALIGFMGSGKSTVGRALAESLKLNLYDLDELIIQRSGRSSVAEIFHYDGEPTFRKMEQETLKDVMENPWSGVLSTGGGVGSRPDLIALMKEGGSIIMYLETTFEVCRKRVHADVVRPLFQDCEKAERLFNERAFFYKTHADYTFITTDKSPAVIVQEIHAVLGGAL
jgi:shikimate kinase